MEKTYFYILNSHTGRKNLHKATKNKYKNKNKNKNKPNLLSRNVLKKQSFT